MHTSRLYYGTTLASTFTIVLEEYAWDEYVCVYYAYSRVACIVHMYYTLVRVYYA